MPFVLWAAGWPNPHLTPFESIEKVPGTCGEKPLAEETCPKPKLAVPSRQEEGDAWAEGLGDGSVVLGK